MGHEVLKFSYHQGWNFEARFEAEWDAAENILHTREGLMKESAHTVTPDQWKAFWIDIDALGAWNWPAEANSVWDDIIEDGPMWSLEISDGKRHFQLSGACGMPKNQDGRRPFAGLIKAIKKLGGRSK